MPDHLSTLKLILLTSTFLSHLFNSIGFVTTTTILDSDLGDLDLFKIQWRGQLTVAIEKNLLKNDPDNVINISTKLGERYKCIVPGDSDDQFDFDSTATNSSSSPGSNNKTNKTPIQVLEPLLRGNYCSYKYELFWIYELCHGKFLRQYHEENAKFKSKITQEYYLGKADSDSLKAHEEEYEKIDKKDRPTILVNGHYKPFVRFNMTSGTKCDLTKSSRISKIIYVCNEEPKHILHSIKEISTCEYEAVVLSPLLCQHKDYKGDTSIQHDIDCFSLEGSPTKPKSMADEEEEDEIEESNSNKRRGMPYFQGKTLIIDADFLLG